MKFNANGYLDSGIHDATVQEIEVYLVTAFPTSTMRSKIIGGYKQHRAELEKLNIEFEQFLDGSFASTKNDPSDVDLVCFADADAVDALSPTEQAALKTLVSGQITKATFLCDAYFCPTVLPTDPRYNDCRANRKYWLGEFGFDRQDIPKGLVRLKVPVVTGAGP